MAKVHFDPAAPHQADLDQTAKDSHGGDVLVPIGPADEIDQHIHPGAGGVFFDHGRKVLIVVVDAHVQAQLGGSSQFLRRTGGAEYESSRMVGQLNGRGAHSAAGGMHQHTLPHL